MDGEERALANEVTLPPDKIDEILRNQPGLMLEVKKALVHKAYEQGRLLDPADLTDIIVLKLVQEDNNVRIIATQQIEDRLYLRAKPRVQDQQAGDYSTDTVNSSSSGNTLKTSDDRQTEAEYWADWERRQRGQQQRELAPGNPIPPASQPPSQAPPAKPVPQQQVNRASADRDIPDVLDTGGTQMTRMRPEDLPGVLQNPVVSPAALKSGSKTTMPSELSNSSVPMGIPRGMDGAVSQPDQSVNEYPPQRRLDRLNGSRNPVNSERDQTDSTTAIRHRRIRTLTFHHSMTSTLKFRNNNPFSIDSVQVYFRIKPETSMTFPWICPWGPNTFWVPGMDSISSCGEEFHSVWSETLIEKAE